MDAAKLMPRQDGEEGADGSLYRAMVGSLLWAAITTRPDMSYTVKELSRHLTDPTPAHALAARRAILYLKGTQDWSLTEHAVG